MNVVLRPLTPPDAAWLDGWLPPIAASAGYHPLDGPYGSASLLARLKDQPQTRARVIVRDGADAGVLVYRLRAPGPADAIIELVATPPASARRGAGIAAAALVEAELSAAGVRQIYAPAAAAHGIAVYFWIRLGYRPLLRPDWPCEREGIAWLRRTLGR